MNMIDQIVEADSRGPWRAAAVLRQCHPVTAYGRYLAAVRRHDLDAVLAQASERYAAALRRLRGSERFSAFFGLWCENYPVHRSVAAWFIDGDSAVLETLGEVGGTSTAARVIMLHDGVTWRVDSERCADGHARMPTPRSTTCLHT